jgi:hypothetical protein
MMFFCGPPFSSPYLPVIYSWLPQPESGPGCVFRSGPYHHLSSMPVRHPADFDSLPRATGHISLFDGKPPWGKLSCAASDHAVSKSMQENVE